MRTKILAPIALTTAMLLAAASSAAGGAKAPGRAGTIAFLRGGGHGLYVIHADGSGLRRVTPPETHVVKYAWSPNRRLIAYIDKRHSLWLIHPDGTGRRSLLPASKLSSLALSWSPDGKKIAIVAAARNSNPRTPKCRAVYVVPVDGGSPVRLDSTGRCDVAWSPRGNEIAYDATKGGILAIHPNGTGRSWLDFWGRVPRWSADGSQLASVETHGFPCPCHRSIGVVDANGNRFHFATQDADSDNAVWSPKGLRILYAVRPPRRRRLRRRANDGGIHVIGANGRNDRRVTTDSPEESLAPMAWSPDGDSIVYVSTRGGLYEVGVNGRGKFRLTSPHDRALALSWVAH
jgi:Tol biopolymer transport system component